MRREVTDAGHSVDSAYGDSLEAAGLADVVGASLVRTVWIAACGGFVLGWLPGLLLLEVLEFNVSFFPGLEERFQWWASAAAQVLQLAALAALLVWRLRDALPLAAARAQLMGVEDAGRGEQAREEAVKEVMAAVGWSYFVQGGLSCWVLISALTLGRVAVLLGLAAAWLLLDAWDLAPFGMEVALARLLPAAAAAPSGGGRAADSGSGHSKKAS